MNSKNIEINPSDTLDITSDVCPMTFVKTKVRLEKMKSGDVLEVLLKGEEPYKNVPRSAEEIGHEILNKEKLDDKGSYRLLIRCK